MNKKFFFIPIAIGIVFIIVWNLTRGGGGDHGNKAVMEVPSTTLAKNETPKYHTVILDNSGSMRGYVDFAGYEKVTRNMVSNISEFMGNADNKLDVESQAVCGGKKYTYGNLIDAMRNYSAFGGAITELDVLIENAIEAAGDSGVAVVVSDMVMSYGKSAIVRSGDKYYNKNKVEDLSSQIGNEFKGLKKSGKGVMVLKYESDFNGDFYYNCTENTIPSDFKKSLMESRPYYFMVIGKDDYIKQLCVSNCFPKPVAVFSTLEIDDADMTQQPFSVEPAQGWQVGEPLNPKMADEQICLWTKSDFREQVSTFDFTFNTIQIPLYARGTVVADYDKDVIQNVSFNQTDINSLKVTFRPFDKLPKEKKDVKIELEIERTCDFSAISTDQDYEVEASAIEHKTWGIRYMLGKIFAAYDIEDDAKQELAELKFAISKK